MALDLGYMTSRKQRMFSPIESSESCVSVPSRNVIEELHLNRLALLRGKDHQSINRVIYGFAVAEERFVLKAELPRNLR